MKKTLTAALALGVCAGGAIAGGLDRSGQGVNILFEEGKVFQLNFAYTKPKVSGSLGPFQSGEVAESFVTPHFAYKHAFNDRLNLAIIYDEPFGADVNYGAAYPLSVNPVPGGRSGTLNATADVQAITALLRYRFENNISVIGGIRGQRAEASVEVPAAAGYRVQTDSPVDFGYVVGVAWEKPEIAARVALTYNSSITHSFSQTESLNPPPVPPIPVGTVATFNSTSEIETPQSINLDFQTGIAPKTLLFGSIRWVDWTATSYNPPNYPPTSNLVDYDDDTITYSLGVGRQFTDQFSGALVLGYEKSNGSTVSDLGPTDGFFSVGLAGTYEMANAKISGGVRYTDIGDAITNNGAVFNDNDALSVGLQLTYYLR